MIEINNVSKVFQKGSLKNKIEEFYADKEINFKANKGEILGILGPNGAGKTTLLRMIAGIMTPTFGTVLVDGMNYQENELKIKSKIAFLSGNTKLYKDITPMELLKMCGSYYQIDKKTVSTRIKEIIKKFAMDDFINQKISTLSTGQMQRVNIARCLIHNPDFYILDEATSGLDIMASKVILDFIKEEKKKGKCILYSTHYMEEAENICDRIVLMHKGRVITIDTKENIEKKTNTTNLRDAFFALLGGDHIE